MHINVIFKQNFREQNVNKTRRQVSAWGLPLSIQSRGGSTDIENCQMLCKTHNRAKGNR
ncbi:MAG: HNH endonuclease [Prevotella sp.]|nr:HNH endonuclease [Prevotella sp.]